MVPCVYILPITSINAFDEYASAILIPHLMQQLETSARIDVVWDTYVSSSIKESTREKRGKGIRRKVAGGIKVPSNWLDFLHDPTNKQELFAFLSAKISSTACPEGKQIFITSDSTVVSKGDCHFCKSVTMRKQILYKNPDAFARCP